MASPSLYAPRCWAMSWGDSLVALRQSAVKLCFPAQHPERLSMRAGRPYYQSCRGNVSSGRRAKTPRVKSGTPSRATLPASGRRLSGDGVRGKPPQINRRVGASFCSLGRQNLFGSPRPARFPRGERSQVGSGDAN